MPSCAAPCAKKVATSKARTRISEICGWVVANTSARLLGSKKSAAGSKPTLASSGSDTQTNRPLGMVQQMRSGLVYDDFNGRSIMGHDSGDNVGDANTEQRG